MGDYHAPQWIDFIETCSPQPPIPDFFETVHTVHERVLSDVTAAEDTENIEPAESQTNVLSVNTRAQEDLNIIKSTPVKIISPKHRNKETTAKETTYEQVLSDAMKKLELCKKPLRAYRDVSNKTNQQSDAFKTPSMPLIKSSRSVGHRSVPNKCVQAGQNSVPRVKINVHANTPVKSNSAPVNMKRTTVSCSLFKENKDAKNNMSKNLNDPADDPKNDEKNEERKAEDDEEHMEKDRKEGNDAKSLQDGPEEQTTDNKNDNDECGLDRVDAKIEKHNQTQPSKRATVLTWQNRRRSLHSKRRSVSASNHYVSLAEAVSRFQTETPKRFRTRSTKENLHATGTTMNMSKMMQNRLKPTIPISPALMSKNRTRVVTVLSQEEREKLEMEEMKKHPIKANPIPRSVFQGPRIKVTGVTRKQAGISSSSFSATQLNEKNCVAKSLQSKSMPLHRDKPTSAAVSKNTVAKVLVTDPAGIIVESEEITFFGVPKDTGVAKSVTRVVPFSFEARNKDLQMKKEQRLKNLQEASKAKPEFHARPVPKFSKSTLPAKQQQQQQQQQQIVKKPVRVLPCPFSFEERDKKLSKKKEQLVKQVIEKDRQTRVFRANPVPTFKPVMVRGRSREHLSIKDKGIKTSEHADKKREDLENQEPNTDSSTSDKCMQKTDSVSSINKMLLMEKREKNVKDLPIELNTDKRAKERREFEEKQKLKEIEEEMKRQEELRKQEIHEKQIKAELRKLAEVKANPMPTYKPLVINKATKQLTTPQSPAFAHKLKTKPV